MNKRHARGEVIGGGVKIVPFVSLLRDIVVQDVKLCILLFCSHAGMNGLIVWNVLQ